MDSELAASVLSLTFEDVGVQTLVEVRRFQAERFVFAVDVAGEKRKVLQVFFGRGDGSLYVNFPYFDLTEGIVGILPLSAFVESSRISIEPLGKVTSHLLKYAHHSDGRAHFSQTGKAITAIRRQSVPLAAEEGHIFSLTVQGLSHFEKVDQKEHGRRSSPRTTLEFVFERTVPTSLKFVGWWYGAADLARRSSGLNCGPSVHLHTPSGAIRQGFLIGPPKGRTFDQYLLLVTCEEIKPLNEDQTPQLTFVGGFDAASVVRDRRKPSEALCAVYPIANPQEVQARIGSVDISGPATEQNDGNEERQ